MVNEWTREDLPTVGRMASLIFDLAGSTYGQAGAILDAVVEHLEKHYPKPAPGLLSSAADCVLDAEDRARAAKTDADRWRRAHEIVERERDQAREQWKKWEHKANEAEREVSTWRTSTESAHSDFLQAAHDRDEAVDRAEAAEARTAPAVARAEIEQAIRGKVWAANRESNDAGFHRVHIDWATDAVWSLLSGDDPAVFVVRESDLPEVERDEDGWTDGTRHGWEGTSKTAMECVETHLEWARFYAAVARAIEAGQATDPVLDKAQEFAALADWELTDREAELLHTVAAHVLGEESHD